MSLITAVREASPISRSIAPTLPPVSRVHLDLLQFDFLRATELAALSCSRWIGRGEKNAADAAAVDAIRAVFDGMEMRGEIIIGEGIKDDAPGLFQGEKVGKWGHGTPRVDIAIDPLDGTTNLSKGLPNAISCIAAAIRHDENIPALQLVPSFYMRKLAYPAAMETACRNDPSLRPDIDAPFSEVIAQTARALKKKPHEVVVMCLDRPRNQAIIEGAREAGATLRLIADGDILAALAPAVASSGIDLYAGIGGGPEAVLAAVGLRCLGGEMLGRMWTRDPAELAELQADGWGERLHRVYHAEDLARGHDMLFVASGISDSSLLRGICRDGANATTHSVLMRPQAPAVRYVQSAHHETPATTTGTSVAEQRRFDRPAVCATNGKRSPLRETSDARGAAFTGIVLVGAPGSGKGTIGKILNRIDGFAHISSGDVIRQSMAEKLLDVDGQTTLAQGGFICDAQLWRLFDSHLASLLQHDKTFGYSKQLVLDGVPRTRAQVDELAKRVDVRAILYFECNNLDVLRERLSHRSLVEGRIDDGVQEVMQNRFRLFEEETAPLLEAYPASMVHRIDATLRPAHVLADVLAQINRLG
ncbi:nucleoside monophosphate kinase [Lacipirellula sp.]|uniref:nucleoside monophosphate kinase n=1 Tax=Lacipirellula sp. TaxID=2691419 RepID=UPI003D115293